MDKIDLVAHEHTIISSVVIYYFFFIDGDCIDALRGAYPDQGTRYVHAGGFYAGIQCQCLAGGDKTDHAILDEHDQAVFGGVVHIHDVLSRRHWLCFVSIGGDHIDIRAGGDIHVACGIMGDGPVLDAGRNTLDRLHSLQLGMDLR